MNIAVKHSLKKSDSASTALNMDILKSVKVQKSINCGGEFHGRCEKDTRCVNCGRNPTNKDCTEYKYNKEIKKRMANSQVGIHEAQKMAEEEAIIRTI